MHSKTQTLCWRGLWQGSEHERPQGNVTPSVKGTIGSPYWPCACLAAVVSRGLEAIGSACLPRGKEHESIQDQEKDLMTLAFLLLSDLVSLRNQSSYSRDG